MNGPGKPSTLTSQVSGADLSRDGANILVRNIDKFNIYGIEIFLMNLKEMDKNQTFLLLLKLWDEIKHALKLNLIKNIAKFAKYLLHL